MIVKKFLSSVLVFVLAFAAVVPSFCFAQDTATNDVNKVVEEKIETEESQSNVATFWSSIKDGSFFVSHKKTLIVSSVITGSVALVSTVAVVFRNNIKEIAKSTYNKTASFVNKKLSKTKTQNISR